jgi:hypothetical protein
MPLLKSSMPLLKSSMPLLKSLMLLLNATTHVPLCVTVPSSQPSASNFYRLKPKYFWLPRDLNELRSVFLI